MSGEGTIAEVMAGTARFGLHAGDFRALLAALPDSCLDSCVCDPPYELGFMGRKWDASGIAYDVDGWREVLRVLKPGAHLLAFGGTRTYHRMACAIEDAGFEIRDSIAWLYACLSEDTEILVDGRWEPWHKATAGHHALCYDAEHDTYSWRPIERLFVFQHDDTAIRIESNRTDQIVTRNHRCLVEQDGEYVFRFAEEIAREREARIPVLEDVQGLLTLLPLPDERAGDAKSDLRTGVCSRRDARATRAKGDAEKNRNGQTHVPVRQGVLACAGLAAGSGGSALLETMQRKGSRGGVGQARSQGAGCLVSEGRARVSRPDDRREEPILEGRGYLLSEARQLQADQVRSVSARVLADGAEGWACDGASPPSCASDWALPVAERDRPPRRSQPAKQRAGESAPVQNQSGSQAVRASRFTAADLARFTPAHYRGLVWCVQVPTGAFVARRNGKVFVTGNSGFPKSLNVSIALDKAAGEMGARGKAITVAGYVDGVDMVPGSVVTRHDPITDAAKQWDGWGTALKPAMEPIVVARKPLGGTVAANVLEHGTGAINVDGCRVPAGARSSGWSKTGSVAGPNTCMGRQYARAPEPDSPERWPANVIHDGSDEVLGAFARYGERASGASVGDGGRIFGSGGGPTHDGYPGDSGTAARFYFCAKASRAERELGCEGLPARTGAEATHRQEDTAGLRSPRAGAGRTASEIRNVHPTVKPLALMRYLCRLVTPPGGVVLDPYTGSGTCGMAALLEGFRYLGAEMDPGHLPIAWARLCHPLRVDVPEETTASGATQLGLFR